MAVDTPAHIAILGAGPIGLEAALYGRFLGYDVNVYERGQVCAHVLRWGHVKLFSPWARNRSTLGLAALKAQDPQWQEPLGEERLTGRELVERYWLPLARSDLLIDHVHEQTEILAVGRDTVGKGELAGNDERGEYDFRILLRDGAGRERIDLAAAVIDATGTYAEHRWLGHGGIPALGELALADKIEYGLPDLEGTDRYLYSGRRVLVVGAGHSAATTIVALTELAKSEPATSVTWVVRRPAMSGTSNPVARIVNDSLVERDRLTQAANALAAAGLVSFRPGTQLDAIAWDEADGCFRVQLSGDHASELHVDRIVANVGYRPDTRLWTELHVQQCSHSEEPTRLSASPGYSQTLLNPEPNFYVLGAKSYGRNSSFLLSDGLEQIREVFSILGDRADLNLYRTAYISQ